MLGLSPLAKWLAPPPSAVSADDYIVFANESETGPLLIELKGRTLRFRRTRYNNTYREEI